MRCARTRHSHTHYIITILAKVCMPGEHKLQSHTHSAQTHGRFPGPGHASWPILAVATLIDKHTACKHRLHRKSLRSACTCMMHRNNYHSAQMHLYIRALGVRSLQLATDVCLNFQAVAVCVSGVCLFCLCRQTILCLLSRTNPTMSILLIPTIFGVCGAGTIAI